MKIEITKTVTEVIEVNTDNLKVIRTKSRDIDSTNIVIYYNEEEIGSGHINNRSNWAHITLEKDNQELEDYLVESIENRTINIQ
jgi:hypothetical protein